MNFGENTFTIHQYDIKVKEIGKPIYLIPFGDIHRFASLCDVEKWLEFIEWARTKHNCYFLGMGDYDDLCSFSERKALNDANLHDETRYTLDEIYDIRVKKLCEEIKFMKDKLVGLIEGNHYGAFSSGITTTQQMCQNLRCKYLGGSSIIVLRFIYGKKVSCIDIYAHHGRGASRLIGGSMNAVQQMDQSVIADIYLQGHDHKKSIATMSKIKITHGKELKMSRKKILTGRTGSFLRGYVDGCSSYVAKALLPPTDLGTLKIELTPKREKRGREDIFYIDLHCSI